MSFVIKILKIVNFWKKKAKAEKFNDTKISKEQMKKICSLKKDKEDSRDYHVATLFRAVELPKEVDMRVDATPIKNQGSLGACSGFAFGAAFEILKGKRTKSLWDTSELFIYYNERVLEGTIDRDSGAYLRDGCKAMAANGASLEYFCPYVISDFKKKPTFSAYVSGNVTRAKSYYRCYNLDEIKTALSQGNPVVAGITVHNNLFSYKGGIYKITSGGVAGGHAICVVGYSDSKNALLIRNSWGIGWGEKGYFWIDYNLFKQLLMDAWVIQI